MSKIKNPNGCRNWSYIIELKKNKRKTEQKDKNAIRDAIKNYNAR